MVLGFLHLQDDRKPVTAFIYLETVLTDLVKKFFRGAGNVDKDLGRCSFSGTSSPLHAEALYQPRDTPGGKAPRGAPGASPPGEPQNRPAPVRLTTALLGPPAPPSPIPG